MGCKAPEVPGMVVLSRNEISTVEIAAYFPLNVSTITLTGITSRGYRPDSSGKFHLPANENVFCAHGKLVNSYVRNDATANVSSTSTSHQSEHSAVSFVLPSVTASSQQQTMDELSARGAIRKGKEERIVYKAAFGENNKMKKGLSTRLYLEDWNLNRQGYVARIKELCKIDEDIVLYDTKGEIREDDEGNRNKSWWSKHKIIYYETLSAKLARETKENVPAQPESISTQLPRFQCTWIYH